MNNLKIQILKKSKNYNLESESEKKVIKLLKKVLL